MRSEPNKSAFHGAPGPKASSVVRICFAGFQSGKPVIPLAYACGVGTAHTYTHREQAIDLLSARAPTLWESVDLDRAEIVVYPHLYTDDGTTRDVAMDACSRKIPCVFFEHRDLESQSLPPYGRIYRTALDARRIRDAERAMSGLSDDMLDRRGGVASLRVWQPKPVVGFCGNVGSRWGDLKATVQGKWGAVHGNRLRRSAIRSLQSANGVSTDFMLRTRYWGGAVRGPQEQLELDSAMTRAKLRSEFIDNLLKTDYALCVRGDGNYSIRFYEVLSAGRIPLFVNSQCVLPFADQIAWKRHCVWIEEAEVEYAGELLLDFHQRLNGTVFEDLQQENRRLWLDWLEATAFYQRVLSLELLQFAGCPERS